MKVPVSDLVKLVREIAQDEIKKQLPALVKECLTEAYLKKIVAESAAPVRAKTSGGRSLAEVLEDTPPEPENPVQDDHPGIYHQDNPLLRRAPAPSEGVQKLLSKNNPMAFVFEGVQPIAPEGQAPVVPQGDVAPPVEKLAAAGLDFNKMNRLLQGMNRKAAESKQMATPNLKMREIEERRKALEVAPPKVE